MLERLFRAAERRAFSPVLALATPVWVALVRMLLERFLSLGDAPLLRQPAHWFAHIAAFYVALFVTLGAVLAVIARIEWKRASSLVGMGLVLGTLPPLIDAALSGRGQFAYEYLPGAIPWSLHRPPRVLPWGETLVLWSTVALMTFAAFRQTRSVARAVAMAVTSYACVLLFLVILPGAAHALASGTGVAPSEWRTVSFALLTLVALVISLGLGRRFVARIPQVVLPPLFAVLGASLKGPLTPPVWLVAGHLAVFGAAFALSNDWYDRKEDAAQGRVTPLDEDGAKWLSLIPLVFAFHVLVLRLEAGLCLVGFAIVAHAYHADPLRLKWDFPISYRTEGLLGGLAFVAGLTASPDIQPTTQQLWVALLVTLGTPAALVFKDVKDVDADAAAGVRTAFVVAEANGWPRRHTQLVASGLLLAALGCVTAYVSVVRAEVEAGLIGLATLAAVTAAMRRSPSRAVFGALIAAELHLAVSAWLLASSLS